MANITNTFPGVPMGTKVRVNAAKGRSTDQYNGTEGKVTGRWSNGLLEVTVTKGLRYGEATRVIEGHFGPIQMLGPLAIWPEELEEI